MITINAVFYRSVLGSRLNQVENRFYLGKVRPFSFLLVTGLTIRMHHRRIQSVQNSSATKATAAGSQKTGTLNFIDDHSFRYSLWRKEKIKTLYKHNLEAQLGHLTSIGHGLFATGDARWPTHTRERRAREPARNWEPTRKLLFSESGPSKNVKIFNNSLA